MTNPILLTNDVLIGQIQFQMYQSYTFDFAEMILRKGSRVKLGGIEGEAR